MSKENIATLSDDLSAAQLAEINKFSAHGWWDDNPLYRMLHAMNPARLQFIDETLRCHWRASEDFSSDFSKILADKKILDIGCGGGILSLPLARMGMQVTGIDLSANAIAEAQQAAGQSNLPINFKQCDVAQLSKIESADKFDAICCLELVEHVDNVSDLFAHINLLLKPGGVLFVSTIRRDLQAKIMAIYLAEYALRLLPIGTHDWQKFLNPADIMQMLYPYGLEFYDLANMVFRPMQKDFRLHRSKNAPNYIMAITNPPFKPIGK